MKRCKFKYPEYEDDHWVHFMRESEATLCGLYFEGANFSGEREYPQDLVPTKGTVTCLDCISIVLDCKKVKFKEMKLP